MKKIIFSLSVMAMLMVACAGGNHLYYGALISSTAKKGWSIALQCFY